MKSRIRDGFHALPSSGQRLLLTPLKSPFLRNLVYRYLLKEHLPNDIRATFINQMPIRTVVHAGAHRGQEAWFYDALGASIVAWIEADPENFGYLEQHIRAFHRADLQQIPILACLSDVSGREVELVRYSNDGASNSIAPETPLFVEMWPGIRPTGETLHLRTVTLRDVCKEIHLEDTGRPRLMVIDVQGHELEVLRGVGIELLALFDFIQVEVSVTPIYEGATAAQVEEFLQLNGFRCLNRLTEDHGDLIFARLEALGNELRQAES